MVETGPSQGRQIVAWSFIGAGVLCGAGAVVTGLIAHGKSNDITNMSAAGAVFDPNIQHDGKLYNNLTIGLGIAGGALAVTGVIVLLTGGSSSPAEAPAQESAPPPPPTAGDRAVARERPRRRGGGLPLLAADVSSHWPRCLLVRDG